jgi:hypothetical protein
VRGVNLRDRQGSDIFGFSNYTETGNGTSGKRQNYSHQAASNNGNLTHWEK